MDDETFSLDDIANFAESPISSETTVFEPNHPHFVPPDSHSNSSTSEETITHFSCSHCGAEFTVPDSTYGAQSYNTRCFSCDKPISIQTIQSQNNLEIIELLGCEYGHTGTPVAAASQKEILHWIENTASNETQRVIDSHSFEAQETFVDKLTAKWIVRPVLGKKIVFEVFNALRKAIEEGKVAAKDKIVAPDGKAYRVDQYPGTADLFGNGNLRREAKVGFKRTSKRPSALLRAVKIAGQTVTLVFCAASLTSLGYFAPQFYSRWVKMQGRAHVDSIVASVQVKTGETFERAYAMGETLLRSGNPIDLPKAVENLEKALSLKPTSIQTMSRLAEGFVEQARLTSNRMDYNSAMELVRYAKALDPKNVAAIRAEARVLWRTGKINKAVELLESQPESFYSSPESHHLLGMLLQEKGDLAQAMVHLNEALLRDPNNLTYLLAMADLFEKDNKFDQAASYLRKAYLISPATEGLTARLGTMYEKAKDTDSAAAVYREAIVRGEKVEKYQVALIRLYSESKQPRDVISESLKYLSMYPQGDLRSEVSTMYQDALTETVPKTEDPSTNDGTVRSRRSRTPRLTSR